MICDDWMLEQLQSICAAVPQTVMMTNSVANNGNPFGAMDYKKYKEEILETGVQVLEYDAGVSYHGKCFVIDDRLSGIGSFNWDMRSTYIDTEIMLVIDSEHVNAQRRKAMAEYRRQSLVVTGEDSYMLPEGVTPQEVGLKWRIVFGLLRLTAGWARFLM